MRSCKPTRVPWNSLPPVTYRGFSLSPLKPDWWNSLILPYGLRLDCPSQQTPAVPSGYLPCGASEARGGRLRSRCCHKVLISADIWSPERPFNSTTAISPHRDWRRVSVSLPGPWLITSQTTNWFDGGLEVAHLGAEVTLGYTDLFIAAIKPLLCSTSQQVEPKWAVKIFWPLLNVLYLLTVE